jgi:dTDP-4-amino-4,6-dideoxygalactose transaminase
MIDAQGSSPMPTRPAIERAETPDNGQETIGMVLAASRPARATFLPFARPLIGDEEIAAVVETLRSGWLTMGQRTRDFEAAFADFVGAPHAVALNSGTAALHLALEAVGVGPGDEVIVPTYTFTASAAVVSHLGARPVIVDVRAADLNIDPHRVEAAITDRTRAIVPVHIAGQPCAMDEIASIAARRNLRVIEDAAHALPTSYRGRRVGSLSDATAFSFYVTKNLTTGEGGMLTTADPEIAKRASTMRLHGLSKDAWKRYTAEGSWHYDVVAPGFKCNMTDIAASLGLCQLAKVEAMAQRRADIAGRYTAALADVPALETPWVNPDAEHAWHLYILRLREGEVAIDRAAFITELAARNIGTSVHFIPLHLHSHYREAGGYEPDSFPVATAEYKRAISLPIYAAMSDQDVDDVISAVLDIVREHGR